MLRASVVVLAVTGALAGCGDDEPTAGSSPAPAPTAAATETPTPTPEPTETPTPTATEQPGPEEQTPTATEQPGPEEQEGGAGDEEEARVPIVFVVGEDGIMPMQAGVPAFLALELIVRNRTSEPVAARLEAAEPITANPGETSRMRLEGRPRGRYEVDFGDAGKAVIVTGVEPGP